MVAPAELAGRSWAAFDAVSSLISTRLVVRKEEQNYFYFGAVRVATSLRDGIGLLRRVGA